MGDPLASRYHHHINHNRNCLNEFHARVENGFDGHFHPEAHQLRGPSVKDIEHTVDDTQCPIPQSSRLRTVAMHGHELRNDIDDDMKTKGKSNAKNASSHEIDTDPALELSASTFQQPSQPRSKRKFINILKTRSSKVRILRRHDARFHRPRPLPSISKWDPRNCDSPKLLHPSPNPSWLEKIQQRLPWYQVTVKSGGGPWLSLRTWDAPYRYFWDEFKYRWDSPGDRAFLVLRLLGISVMLFVFLLMNVAEVGVFYADKNHVERIWDWFHEITIPINELVWNNEAAYSAFMFFAGLFMDVLLLWIFFHWMIMGDSLRLPLAYGLLYGIRALQRFYCILPFAPGYLWKHPKFGSVRWPSLAVPYITGDDFFFSGHVGCGTLAIVEHYYNRNWWGFGYSIFATLYEIFWLTVTRGHYMIDMFAGAIVASWVHMVAQIITRPIDQWLGIPPRPIVPKEYARLSCRDSEDFPSPSSLKDIHYTTEEDDDDQQQLSPSTTTGNNTQEDTDDNGSSPSPVPRVSSPSIVVPSPSINPADAAGVVELHFNGYIDDRHPLPLEKLP